VFDAESKLLNCTLGHAAQAIHHIGSIAVPGLAAKTIIDNLIQVSAQEELDALNQRMESIGCTPKGEFGIPGRRYFQKGGDNARINCMHLRALSLDEPCV
jgi:GrpB-like predicted nucleotidyltransferase (UPF0157 family)